MPLGEKAVGWRIDLLSCWPYIWDGSENKYREAALLNILNINIGTEVFFFSWKHLMPFKVSESSAGKCFADFSLYGVQVGYSINADLGFSVLSLQFGGRLISGNTLSETGDYCVLVRTKILISRILQCHRNRGKKGPLQISCLIDCTTSNFCIRFLSTLQFSSRRTHIFQS